ncbi:MAG: hypothetical protein AB8G22_07065 [Saprospiraceae bacterium]
MLKKLPTYFELTARIHVFLLLNVYGWGKIAGGQFYSKGQLPADIASLPISEIGGFDLLWTFMGYSYIYILFVGISQIIGAWLLLWNRTKLLGVAILIPILSNIIILDALFFEGLALGALASAVVYFSLLMYILYFNRIQVKVILEKILTPLRKNSIERPRWQQILIALSLFVVSFGLEQLIINALGH